MAGASVLTEDEMREYADIADRDEWGGGRWSEPVRPAAPGTPFVVFLSESQLPAHHDRARTRGKSDSEHIQSVVDMFLATA